MNGREFFKSGSEYRIEFRILHPIGGERWLAGRGTLTRDTADRPMRFTGINLDITDRKLAELREAKRHKDEFLAMLAMNLEILLGLLLLRSNSCGTKTSLACCMSCVT